MANQVTRRSADLPIEIEKGSTFRHKFTWKSGIAGSETPVDLTGASGQMQLRPTITSNEISFELRSADTATDISGLYAADETGITFGSTDPIDGTIHLFISDANTSAFNFKKAVYSLEIKLANGDVRTLVRGSISAYDEITR